MRHHHLSDRELLELILIEMAENAARLACIERILNKGRITKSIANRFSGDSTMPNNALVFNVGQTSIDTITPLLADGVTPSGGTLSNVSVNFSDPSATAVLNPDNTITFTGVAPSTSPVSGSVSCTVTDTDQAISTWTQAFTVQTNAVVPPSQLTQSVANVFSTPTP